MNLKEAGIPENGKLFGWTFNLNVRVCQCEGPAIKAEALTQDFYTELLAHGYGGGYNPGETCGAYVATTQEALVALVAEVKKQLKPATPAVKTVAGSKRND